MPVGPEFRLSNDEEILFRQVHVAWIHRGRPSSQMFSPTGKDAGLLSVDRESIAGSAALSLARYQNAGLSSAGAWGVTVAEVEAEGLHAYEDPLPGNDAHAVIDFGPLAPSQRKGAAARLSVSTARLSACRPSRSAAWR